MPKLWTETIESHRRGVRDAILATTWALVVEHGLMSVTMSQIASATGIGRATLYKYFPDIEAILRAYHQQHVETHLQHLAELEAQFADPRRRLEAVLTAFARICRHRARHGTVELEALLHRGEQATEAQRQLVRLFRDVLAECAALGHVRTDVDVEELATYCLHALGAAGHLGSEDAVGRLVGVTLGGLRPQPPSRSGGRSPRRAG